jgi:alkanesulfonate monooxygenase SsuD/methylene tetrahydromethanopterin reductase-like flavin-dependent oxidoreductase (luciferase family)
MEFGIFHEFPRRAGQADAEAFAEGFELVDASEAWGLDAIWLAELHFAPKRSVLGAPMTIASAIAARTRRVRIGMAVQVLPLANPLRIAEEAATVDQISQGRLIFGVGRSGSPRAYEAYGIPYVESRERFAEALEMILRGWTEPSLTFEGRFHSCQNVSVVPKPYQQPYPEIRVAANSAESFTNMGRRGLPIFVAVRFGNFLTLAPNIKAYRAAYREAGHPGEGQVFLRVPVYVGETAAGALEEPRESIMEFYRILTDQFGSSLSRAGTAVTTGLIERVERLRNLTYEDALEQQLIVGSPQQVRERLTVLKAELGLDGILGEFNPGGLIPHTRVMDSLRRFCDQVIPAVA